MVYALFDPAEGVMILVVGATGLVGSQVCLKLAARGESVRALVRATSDKEKVEALRSAGVELCIGDLKERLSLAAACRGVDAVISTASSTFSRQEGDSIESVDAVGQQSLVDAAKAAGVDRFVFVSFRHSPAISFPLDDAKRQIEQSLGSMNYTIIQASFFMEVWLSPELGFNYAHAKARVCGSGTAPTSWVSFLDVAEMCARAVTYPAAARRVIEFGGPEAMSLLDVVACFEKIGDRPFELEHIPEEALVSQFEVAAEPMQKTFAALMLGCAYGDAIDMQALASEFDIKLTRVEEYADRVLAVTARA